MESGPRSARQYAGQWRFSVYHGQRRRLSAERRNVLEALVRRHRAGCEVFGEGAAVHLSVVGKNRAYGDDD